MVHWPSSLGALRSLAATRPVSGVGADRACPICSRVKTSLSGTGAGSVCPEALLATQASVRAAASEVLINLIPSAGTPWQEDESEPGHEGGEGKATSQHDTP